LSTMVKWRSQSLAGGCVPDSCYELGSGQKFLTIAAEFDMPNIWPYWRSWGAIINQWRSDRLTARNLPDAYGPVTGAGRYEAAILAETSQQDRFIVSHGFSDRLTGLSIPYLGDATGVVAGTGNDMKPVRTVIGEVHFLTMLEN